MLALVHPTFILIMLINLVILGTKKIKWLITLIAFQGVALGFEPLFFEGFKTSVLLMTIGAIAIKGIAIPTMLLKAVHDVGNRIESVSLIGSVPSMLIGVFGTGVAIVLTRDIPGSADIDVGTVVTVLVSTLLTGFLLLVTRLKAIEQALGYLIFENSIFVFGLLLLKKMPLIMELGVLLDLWVGVFVMGFVLSQIAHEFSTFDTRKLTLLKE